MSILVKASAASPVQRHDRDVDEFTVQCPYCGEEVTIYIEPDVRGTFVQDCEVCCNPWRVRVSGVDDERVVDVARADGSE
jgi:Cysteine-rich CPXCG